MKHANDKVCFSNKNVVIFSTAVTNICKRPCRLYYTFTQGSQLLIFDFVLFS